MQDGLFTNFPLPKSCRINAFYFDSDSWLTRLKEESRDSAFPVGQIWFLCLRLVNSPLSYFLAYLSSTSRLISIKGQAFLAKLKAMFTSLVTVSMLICPVGLVSFVARANRFFHCLLFWPLTKFLLLWKGPAKEGIFPKPFKMSISQRVFRKETKVGHLGWRRSWDLFLSLLPFLRIAMQTSCEKRRLFSAKGLVESLTRVVRERKWPSFFSRGGLALIYLPGFFKKAPKVSMMAVTKKNLVTLNGLIHEAALNNFSSHGIFRPIFKQKVWKLRKKEALKGNLQWIYFCFFAWSIGSILGSLILLFCRHSAFVTISFSLGKMDLPTNETFPPGDSEAVFRPWWITKYSINAKSGPARTDRRRSRPWSRRSSQSATSSSWGHCGFVGTAVIFCDLLSGGRPIQKCAW